MAGPTGGPTLLRFLHLEDSPEDAELVGSILAETFACEGRRVQTRPEFVAALDAGGFDVILSDFSLPGFDGLAALEAARRTQPEVPFIFVSGTIGEEKAIESLKRGGTDYVLKDNLSRLPAAVRRALEEAAQRRARRQAEEELAESRRLVERIVESSPDAVYVVDLEERRTIFSNHQLARLLGYAPEEEAAPRDPFDAAALHPEDAGRLPQELARFVEARDGAVLEREFRMRHRRGGWRWLNARETVFGRGRGGSPATILGLAKDVTKKKLDEQRWAVQYEATHVLAESATWESAVPRLLECLCRRLGFALGELWEPEPAGRLLRHVAIWHLPGVEAGDWMGSSRGLGFPAGSGLIGRAWESGRPEWVADVLEDPGFTRRRLAEAAGLRGALALPLRGGPEAGPCGVMALFGREPVDDGSLAVVVETLGNQIGEFRERKRAQEKIREQAALLECAREAILVEDLAGQITYWNPAAERLYGCRAAEAMEEGVKSLLYEGTPATVREARTRVLTEGAWSGLLDQKTRAGAEIVVQSHWTLIRDAAARPTSLLVINTDVTEARRLEAKFMRAQRMESIGALAGGIAHDLNNVLSPILMAVEILRRKLADPQGLRILGTLETSARRGADLVKQVLTFARGSEGERTTLQVGHLVREMEKIARETFPKSIRVRVDVAGDLWTVSGQATPLHQVLMNLCVNARDAMPAGGTLALRAENVVLDDATCRVNPGSSPGPHILLTVSDTGTGIEGEHLERIFDPFFTTKVGSGTGLGLSTSSSIVKSHGGFMDVYSERDRGTSFKVFLPALPGSEATSGETDLPPLPVGHGELVLIVDDEASVREIAREILEAQGYRTLTASDGREAVRLYEEHQGEVRVVLTDLAMPNMDGREAIRALRTLDPALPIVAASGLGTGPQLDEAETLEVQAFLSKPYTSQTLLETLQAVLRLRD